jgi:hypothetical protein
MNKSSACWEWISACCFYNVFLLFLGSSAAPNLPLLFHFVPTAAAISCPWFAGQVAAAASPGTAVLAAAIVRSVRGVVLSLLCRLEFTALTTAQLCFVLWFLVTHILFPCSSTSNRLFCRSLAGWHSRLTTQQSSQVCSAPALVHLHLELQVWVQIIMGNVFFTLQ